jgi:hypothetical protein
MWLNDDIFFVNVYKFQSEIVNLIKIQTKDQQNLE